MVDSCRGPRLTVPVNMGYDYTGTVRTVADLYGHTATQTPDQNRNYAVPSAMTTGSLGSTFSWNGAMQMTEGQGPNGATTLASYDTYQRPASRTEANGRVTNYNYGPDWTRAVTGTRYTKSYVDGFGRTRKAESGYTQGWTEVVVSTVETKYVPCACSPLGKVWKRSLPYGPGGTPEWTEYVYL